MTVQDFHMNYVLVPADKAAYSVVVVWRLYYIYTLKRELVDTNKSKEGGKDQETIQSSTTPDPGYHMEK